MRASWQKLFLALVELLRRNRLDKCRLVVSVFNDRDPAQHFALLEYDSRHRLDDFSETVIEDRSMIDFGPVVLPQSDQHHLVQARLDLACKSGVRLDPARDDHVIALEGVAIEMDGDALRRPDRR